MNPLDATFLRLSIFRNLQNSKWPTLKTTSIEKTVINKLNVGIYDPSKCWKLNVEYKQNIINALKFTFINFIFFFQKKEPKNLHQLG